MQESKQIVKRKRVSYRTGQTNPYRLTAEIKDMIRRNKDLFRFIEDYFNVNHYTVYRWLRSNDPALTQIGFLQDLLKKVGYSNIDALIEKAGHATH